jgi:hypothetical protein
MSTRYTGVSNLPAPENCTMILIDHQPLQFAGVQNIDGTLLVNTVVGLAKTAKVFGGNIGTSLAWGFQLLTTHPQETSA